MGNTRRSSDNLNQQRGAHKVPLTEEMLGQLLAMEAKKIEMRISEKELRERHINNQAEIAKQQLSYQAEFLRNKPKQDRLSFITLGVISTVLLMVILAFLLLLIYWKETEFAKYLLITISHITVGSLSYFAGTRRRQTGEKVMGEEGVDEAQIID